MVIQNTVENINKKSPNLFFLFFIFVLIKIFFTLSFLSHESQHKNFSMIENCGTYLKDKKKKKIL